MMPQLKNLPLFDPACLAQRDKPRINAQMLRVSRLMLDGMWRSLEEIALATGDPQASVSARLRDMRKRGHVVERKNLGGGLWHYRIGK